MSKKDGNRFLQSEQMLANTREEKPVAPVETVAERYARELEEKEKKKGVARVSLNVPAPIKEEIDELVSKGEIKNINHFINYLIKDYLDNRKANKQETEE